MPPFVKTPSIVTYYGGKQMMVPILLKLIPEHTLYCEPFFGGGALFFAKPKSKVEVINDLNGEVINFYRVVQKQFSEIEVEIKSTLHSRDSFRQARVVYENPDMFTPVKRGWAFWTLTNEGFSSLLTSWGCAKDSSKEVSLDNKRKGFSIEYAHRLETVQVESGNALKVIDRCDSLESFFYLDPPYIGSNQGHYKGYTTADYLLLLERLSTLQGKFLLSSYPSPELSGFIEKQNWQTTSFDKKVAVTKFAKKVKTEVLVWNY